MERRKYEDYDDYYEEDEIDLADLLFMLIRRWKVIVLVTIPVVMLGFFVASTRPSVYRADTTLMVSNGMQATGLDNSDISLNQKLVVTYSEIAKSRDILRRVITKYDLPENIQQLSNAINISVVKDTELIKLSYTCGDSKLAEAVTNEVANEFIQKVSQVMRVRNVEIRGDETVRQYITNSIPATEEDWATEYEDYIVAIKVVDDLDEVIKHIAKYGTKHSESIITENYSNAQRFLNEVDAAAVYVNASTRFTDGGQFGFGAEIGISTQKLHARGPMGLKELTTTKYVIMGNGQVRE